MNTYAVLLVLLLAQTPRNVTVAVYTTFLFHRSESGCLPDRSQNVVDTDSGSLFIFNFPRHCGIGDFRKFIIQSSADFQDTRRAK